MLCRRLQTLVDTEGLEPPTCPIGSDRSQVLAPGLEPGTFAM